MQNNTKCCKTKTLYTTNYLLFTQTYKMRQNICCSPSLSALNSLQGVDFQPCRLFLYPKSCTKNAPTPFLRITAYWSKFIYSSKIVHFI